METKAEITFRRCRFFRHPVSVVKFIENADKSGE
jgi:hypothetical protein